MMENERPTVIILFQVLVEDGVILDDVLCRRRPDGSPVRIEELGLKITLPKFCLR